MQSSGAVDKQTVMTLNQRYVQGPRTSQDIKSINNGKQSSAPGYTSVHSAGNTSFRQSNVQQAFPSSAAPPVISSRPIPPLNKPIQKGQKAALENEKKLLKIEARLGWNVTNPACDVDVSAFLLNSTGKVIGDAWFVFYGQDTSPDKSTVFSQAQDQDIEMITIDFTKMNSSVSKIVFVLTINEALEKQLNFSMLKDAYIRIIDASTNSELVSFKMEEYYSNVTSMMIGEIYQHNGAWKFNAIGNGVARDLAGLCELYGVQVI